MQGEAILICKWDRLPKKDYKNNIVVSMKICGMQ